MQGHEQRLTFELAETAHPERDRRQDRWSSTARDAEATGNCERDRRPATTKQPTSRWKMNWRPRSSSWERCRSSVRPAYRNSAIGRNQCQNSTEVKRDGPAKQDTACRLLFCAS